MTSGPYSTKLPGSTRSLTFSRAVRWPVRAAAFDGVGPRRVEAELVAGLRLGEIVANACGDGRLVDCDRSHRGSFLGDQERRPAA